MLLSSLGSSTKPDFAIRRLMNSVPLEFIVWETPVLWVQLQLSWSSLNKNGIYNIIALEHATKQEGEDHKSKKLWTFGRAR